MDRHHPIFGKRFEFVQAYKPAFKVSFLQIKVRLVVDQIRREKRFQFENVHGCDVLALTFTELDNLQFDTFKRQNWLSQGLRNHQPPRSLPSFSCSIENI